MDILINPESLDHILIVLVMLSVLGVTARYLKAPS